MRLHRVYARQVKKENNMLGLKLKTDPRWVKIAESNVSEILTDHAWCEQKAATNAITLIVHNPAIPELVTELIKLACEEMDHFNQVHDFIIKRGYILGKERKDDYVNKLMAFTRKGFSHEIQLLDKLLFSALIEARSCERFRVLSLNIEDQELASFYHELMISEAGHYTLYLSLARKYCAGQDVDARWNEYLDFEGNLIESYGKSEQIHG